MGKELFAILVILGAVNAWAQEPDAGVAKPDKRITVSLAALSPKDQQNVLRALRQSVSLDKTTFGHLKALDSFNDHAAITLPTEKPGYINSRGFVTQDYEPQDTSLKQSIPEDLSASEKTLHKTLHDLPRHYVINPDGFVKMVVITNEHGFHGIKAQYNIK